LNATHKILKKIAPCFAFVASVKTHIMKHQPLNIHGVDVRQKKLDQNVLFEATN